MFDGIYSSDKKRILFSHKELADKERNYIRIPQVVRNLLRDTREFFRRPIILNSACRSKEYNESIGGHPRSLHVYDQPYWPTCGCIAFDIARQDDEYDADLIMTFWRFGWSVGVSGSFIHVDARTVVLGMEQKFWYYKYYRGRVFDDIIEKYPVEK